MVTHDGKMGVPKITLFCICAVIVLSTLTASASLGPGGLLLWLIAVVCFVIPNMMITSELGTAYPAEGGMYDWINYAFGRRMSARSIILYWLSNGIWMGANYILLTGILVHAFIPAMPLSIQLFIVVVLIWLTVLFICYKSNVGVWLTICGAIFKVSIIMVIGIGGFWYALTHHVANAFTPQTLIPSSNSGIGFFSAIIYNITGFELVACMGSQLRKPARDMPRAILYSSLAVVFLYVFGSMGILMAIPVANINLVTGIPDVVRAIFNNPYVTNIVTILFLFTIICDQVTWSMAPSRAAAEAANNGDLPKFIGKWHPRYNTPYGANIVLGITGTLVTLIYSYFASGNSADTFWSIFSFSSVCIISSYILYYLSYMKLRLTDGKTARPFTIPGGLVVAWLCTLLCLAFIVICIILFVFPDILSLTISWDHSAPIIIGMAIILLASELLIRKTEAHNGITTLNIK